MLDTFNASDLGFCWELCKRVSLQSCCNFWKQEQPYCFHPWFKSHLLGGHFYSWTSVGCRSVAFRVVWTIGYCCESIKPRSLNLCPFESDVWGLGVNLFLLMVAQNGCHGDAYVFRNGKQSRTFSGTKVTDRGLPASSTMRSTFLLLASRSSLVFSYSSLDGLRHGPPNPLVKGANDQVRPSHTHVQVITQVCTPGARDHSDHFGSSPMTSTQTGTVNYLPKSSISDSDADSSLSVLESCGHALTWWCGYSRCSRQWWILWISVGIGDFLLTLRSSSQDLFTSSQSGSSKSDMCEHFHWGLSSSKLNGVHIIQTLLSTGNLQYLWATT